MEEEQARTKEEIAKEAGAFLNAIADDATRRRIPPQVIISLFGLFARQLVDGLIESGKPREEAISEVAGRFMDGLGVATMFKHIHLNDNPANFH